MESQRTNSSLAARAGRWSARHKKTAIFGWLAFVLIATVLGWLRDRAPGDQARGPARVRRPSRLRE